MNTTTAEKGVVTNGCRIEWDRPTWLVTDVRTGDFLGTLDSLSEAASFAEQGVIQ